MKKTILTTALLLTLGQIGFSQNLDKTKLDNYFNALEQNNKFMRAFPQNRLDERDE